MEPALSEAAALPGQAIIKAFRKAVTLAVQLVKDASVSIEGKDPEDKKALLQKCASTTLNSKLASPPSPPCPKIRQLPSYHFTKVCVLLLLDLLPVLGHVCTTPFHVP